MMRIIRAHRGRLSITGCRHQACSQSPQAHTPAGHCPWMLAAQMQLRQDTACPGKARVRQLCHPAAGSSMVAAFHTASSSMTVRSACCPLLQMTAHCVRPISCRWRISSGMDSSHIYSSRLFSSRTTCQPAQQTHKWLLHACLLWPQWLQLLHTRSVTHSPESTCYGQRNNSLTRMGLRQHLQVAC